MASTAISEVRICNMAMSMIGASSKIETLTEDTAEAQECNLWYTYSRKQALAANDWSFARRRLTLATHNDDPPSGIWAYRYQYPSDCVVLRNLQNPSGVAAIACLNDNFTTFDAVPFEVETASSQTDLSILTDLDEAVAVYTFDLTEVLLFSEFFVQMLAAALAANTAFTLTGQSELEDKMVQRFQLMSRAARASDANEAVGKPPRDVDYIRARA